MATLKDIAAACGVDISTVSRALRKDPRVKPETTELINKTAAKLNYKPNLMARALVEGKTRMIWFIVPTLEARLEHSEATHSSAYLMDKGYNLLISQYHEDEKALLEILDKLDQGMADGAIIMPSEICRSKAVIQKLKEIKCPFVFIDRNIPELKVHNVTTDNEKGAEELTGLCLKKGSELMLSLFTDVNSVELVRQQGTERACKKNKTPLISVNELKSAKFKNAKKIGIIASSQKILMNMLKENYSYFKGKELYFANFDFWIGDTAPAETSFVCVQDFKKLSEISVDKLMDLINSKKSKKPKVILAAPLKFEKIERMN